MVKITRYLYCQLVLIAWLSAFQAYGQTQLEKELARNKQLSDTVQTLMNSFNRLDSLVQSKRDELASIQEVLADNKRTIDNANSSTQKERLKAMQDQVDSLETAVQNMLDANRGLMNQRDELANRNSDAEIKLSKMDEFQEIKERNEAEKKAQQLAERYEQNKRLLTMRYSQISDDKLNEIKATVNDFKGMKGFAEYQKRVDAAIANKALFEKANAFLITPYTDEVRIMHNRLYLDGSGLLKVKKDNIAKGVFKLSEEDLDGKGSQFHEMDSIDISLSRYKDGVCALNGIINRVNQDKVVAAYRDSNDSSKKRECRDAINNAIESYVFTVNGSKYNLQEIKERYFAHIPYLNQAFEQYLKQLKKSPLQKTEIEQEILSIKVK